MAGEGSGVPGADVPGGPEFWEVELWLAPTAMTETTFVCETTSSPGLLMRMMITTFDCCGWTAAAAAFAAWSVAACCATSGGDPSAEVAPEPAAWPVRASLAAAPTTETSFCCVAFSPPELSVRVAPMALDCWG